MDIAQILKLQNIAVVGFSKNPEKPSYRVPAYLISKGYNVIPINPFAGEQLVGRKVYKTVKEVPDRVDVVVVFRPSEEVPAVVQDVLERKDVQVLWLQEGIVNDQAATLAQENGLVVVQDRCMYKEHRAITNSEQGSEK